MMAVSKSDLPKTALLAQEIPKALKKLGGEAALQEIEEAVVSALELSPEHMAIEHEAGKPRGEIDYRMAWARTKLKKTGELVRVAKGVWALPEKGS